MILDDLVEDIEASDITEEDLRKMSTGSLLNLHGNLRKQKKELKGLLEVFKADANMDSGLVIGLELVINIFKVKIGHVDIILFDRIPLPDCFEDWVTKKSADQ